MKSYQWMTPVVVALAVAISPAWAKKGGNGGGGGGGGGDAGGGTPPTAGTIVFYDDLGTSEVSPDGSNLRLKIPQEYGDPSNRVYAGGDRWYLVVRETEYLPLIESGEVVDVIAVENIFAVNSETGDEIQLTNFSGDYLYIANLRCSWTRDTSDSQIAFVAYDESVYATTHDGLPAYDFTGGYDSPPASLIVIPISSGDIDAAYRSGDPIPPFGWEDLIISPATAPVGTEYFTVSSDGLFGAYSRHIAVTEVVNLVTGEIVAAVSNLSQPAWTPDGDLLLDENLGGLYHFDVLTGQTTSIVGETGNLFGTRFPVCSPDGVSFAYTAREKKKGNYTDGVISQNLDGSGQQTSFAVETPATVETVRWVED
ncbi:hypothetical protein NG895_04335 [Aeoliella sp. ICT_H6.2]|uniref:WD40 repeat protein n=1 Tax=Aeoliella straminimaris TaxID=2954799 RepID=A0A9X2JHP4_9BACT|nr:hypothetical protein [Aeoliella straminimaris]MCO6043124.1 hypothetical protein [Aeoliella straminimaris]